MIKVRAKMKLSSIETEIEASEKDPAERSKALGNVIQYLRHLKQIDNGGVIEFEMSPPTIEEMTAE